MMYLVDQIHGPITNPFSNFNYSLVDNISLVEYFLFESQRFFSKVSFTPNSYRVDLVVMRIPNS